MLSEKFRMEKEICEIKKEILGTRVQTTLSLNIISMQARL